MPEPAALSRRLLLPNRLFNHRLASLVSKHGGLGCSAIRKGHGEALCHWEPEPYCLPGDDYARSMVKEVLRAPKDRPLHVLLSVSAAVQLLRASCMA